MILYFVTLVLLYLRFNHAIDVEYTLIFFLPAIQFLLNTLWLTFLVEFNRNTYEKKAQEMLKR